MLNLNELKKIYGEQEANFIAEWKEFLTHQSISTDPTYNDRCVKCADWLLAHLKCAGFAGELLPTSGKPVVYAEHRGDPSAPTIIFYGHYDVQPVDPVELWKSDPFKAELRDGRMYARGAEDNKGQLFYVIKAAQVLLARKSLPYNLKFFIEGEEESSSGGITKALSTWGDKVKGDVLMVCDTGMLQPGMPTVTMGLRGIVYLTAVLSGPNKDLHSGVHGGVAPNPALEMARLVASLHDENHKIAISGFYDGIHPPSSEDVALANRQSIPDEFYKGLTGVLPVGGERNKSFAERRGFRPTIEINGIHSGYGGPGTKTIIPSNAEAKISARLVAGQDPAKCLQMIIDHLKRHSPAGLELEIKDAGVGGEAVSLSANNVHIKRADKILSEIFGREVVYLWEGASIPIIAQFAKVSGGAPVLVGFGLDEDNIHAPNESFSLEQFKSGFLYAGLFLGGYGA